MQNINAMVAARTSRFGKLGVPSYADNLSILAMCPLCVTASWGNDRHPNQTRPRNMVKADAHQCGSAAQIRIHSKRLFESSSRMLFPVRVHDRSPWCVCTICCSPSRALSTLLAQQLTLP